MALFITFTNGAQTTCTFNSKRHLEMRMEKFVLLGWLSKEQARGYVEQWIERG